MKISVITVCKNAEKDIEQAIQSVVSQTYSDVEYIIVDGDSQDRTKHIISQYRDKISRFISESDSGLYQAMNKGIRYSTGDYICFLNADDYFVDERVIEDVAHFLSEHPSYDFIYSDMVVRYPSGRAILVKPPLPDAIADELICGCLPHQASFTKADLFFSKIGFFNEGYRISSDYEWFLKLAQHEMVKLGYFPRTITSYYAGGLSSQIRLAIPESYKIQNSFPPLQCEYWLKRRLLKFQEYVINLREWLTATESDRDRLAANYQTLQADYQALLLQHQQTQAELESARAALAKLHVNQHINQLQLVDLETSRS
ncbi:MAG: glycosyltransferase [Synechococcales cyanobacterium C42_A2020_086]|nr:glycosyltransferase [Synechococcales cyanobacterium C42_A2020_086]